MRLRKPSPFLARLLLIALAGVAVRLVYVYVLTRGTKGIGDWFYFHYQANDIAHGKWFVEPLKLRFEGREVASASHPPLWPLLLAGVSKLGWTGYLAHRAVGCVVGGGTIVAIGYLGRRVGGERVGLAAAALFAAYPLMVAADGSLMSESLYALLVTLVLLAAYRLLDRPGGISAVLLGAAIGLASLVRSESLLFLPLLALPLAWRGPPPRLGTAAFACAALVLVITPWSVRNLLTFHRPVVISTNGPAALAGANCPQTYSGPEIGYWRLDCISRARSDNEAKEGVRWTKEGLGYMRDHRGQLPKVMAVRFLRTWDLYQPRRMVAFAEGRNRYAERAGIATYFLLLPLAAYGIVLLHRRRQPLLVLLVPALLCSIVSVVWYGIPRFRHAAEIPLVVLAAVALVALAGRAVERWRARRSRPERLGYAREHA